MKNTNEVVKPAYQIKAYSPFLAGLESLKEQYNYLPDCSTDDGLKSVKADYRAIRKVEINLDSKRKELGEKARKTLTSINDEAKEIDGKLKKISAPFKTAFELREAELKAQKEKRIAELQVKINDIKAFSDTTNMSSDNISDVIEAVNDIDCLQGFYELTEDAVRVKSNVLDSLGKDLVDALAREQVAIETKKLEEQQRITDLKNQAQQRLNNLMLIPVKFMGKPSEEIKSKINSLSEYRVPEDEFGELYGTACQSVLTVMEQLQAMLSQQLLLEESQAAQAKSEEQQPIVSCSADKEVTPAIQHEAVQLANQMQAETVCNSPDVQMNEEPTLIEVSQFLSSVSGSTVSDFGYLLLSNDERHEAEALHKIKEAFQYFLQKNAA